MNKSIIWSFILLIIVAAVYRIIPNRPWGFTPHLAMALFAGAIIKDKKWAFALPVFSIFISDMIYQLLFLNGLSQIPGFYEGQLTNYLLFAAVTCIGFLMKKITPARVVGYAASTATIFFIVSNFMVWINGAGYSRPKTWVGLMQCYTDALPFYKGSLQATIVFSVVLFAGYWFLNRPTLRPGVL